LRKAWNSSGLIQLFPSRFPLRYRSFNAATILLAMTLTSSLTNPVLPPHTPAALACFFRVLSAYQSAAPTIPLAPPSLILPGANEWSLFVWGRLSPLGTLRLFPWFRGRQDRALGAAFTFCFGTVDRVFCGRLWRPPLNWDASQSF